MQAKKSFNISLWALQHPALTRYLMVVMLVMGVFSYFQLGQDEDPPFTFRVMAITTVWPGATAQQVAEQVTDKLERTLQEVPYADRIQSYSKPGESQIIFELKDSSPSAEVENAWYSVRKKIGDMRHTLPSNIKGPFFNDDFGDVYGVIYALKADAGFSYAELKVFADEVRQQLLRVDNVAKVAEFGVQEEKVYIEISPKRLAQLGLDLTAVLAQLSQQNAIESAGAMATPLDAVQLRVAGQFMQVDQLRAMPIRGASGHQLRLGDIAEVRRGYIDPPENKVRHQGSEVIALGISMADGGDIIALGKALKQKIKEIEANLPHGITLSQIQDQPQAVAASVNEFVKVLIEAVVIVLLVSFISLGLHRRSGTLRWWQGYSLDWRPGLVVAITIPLVLAVTFLAMHYWNIGLHKISLGSLIIALGLLVDDAIIAVEMMVRKMEEGYDKMRAATFAYEITAIPMLTGTLITAAGFLPIGLAKSVTGEYTFAIFAVTVIALVLSWIVSVYFVPYLGTLFLKPAHPETPDSASKHELFDSAIYRGFRHVLTLCLEFRWLTLGATLLIFVLGIVGMGRVQQQFFPDSSRPEILVSLWAPEGASFVYSEDIAQRVEARFMQEEGIASVSTWIGSGVPRFYLPLNQIFPQTNVSELIVKTKNTRARNALLQKLPQILDQEFPEIRARASLLPNGPPVEYPVQFRVLGNDPEILRLRADEVKAVLAASPNMLGVNDNWREYIKTIRFDIDQSKARALGVSSQTISQSIQTWIEGAHVGQFRENDKLIEIVLRQPLQERSAISDIKNIYLPTTTGKAIALTQIAKPVFAWEYGVLWRENRDYAITVQGDVAVGLQGATVTHQLLPALRQIEAQWHANGQSQYRIEVAGAVEQSSKGSASIVAGLPAMLVIVFTLLMLQLQSFSRSVLVFVTGPLGIAGVAAALLLFDRPFGFVALLGVIALMGMIQRNSVILLDQIDKEQANGLPAWDAIIVATVGRMRPIALTAAAAVLAMIPLSRSVFWGPMAIALMGGLVVATVLTLLALPAMYAVWFRVKKEPISG